MSVVFPEQPSGREAPYWVLGTDYLNYAVVWACNNINEAGSTRVVWILTRDRQPSDAIVEAAYDVLKENEVSTTFLRKTIQNGCE